MQRAFYEAHKPVSERKLLVRGQGVKPLYQARDGTALADINARMASARKRERKNARRRELLAKGAIKGLRDAGLLGAGA